MQGHGTAMLWSALRGAVQKSGYQLDKGAFQEVNRLRGVASRSRRAMEAFARAKPDAAITNRMVSDFINSRPLNERILSPEYDIRVQYFYHDQDGLHENWVTITGLERLPATKQDVMDLAQVYSQVWAGNYGHQIEAVGLVHIASV